MGGRSREVEGLRGCVVAVRGVQEVVVCVDLLAYSFKVVDVAVGGRVVVVVVVVVVRVVGLFASLGSWLVVWYVGGLVGGASE